MKEFVTMSDATAYRPQFVYMDEHNLHWEIVALDLLNKNSTHTSTNIQRLLEYLEKRHYSEIGFFCF